MFAVVLAMMGALLTATEPPAADPIAASRAQGDALLLAAHAQSVFVNETGAGPRPSTDILLRHRASGYRCSFAPGEPLNRVTVYRSLTPGSDVGCTTRGPTTIRTLYIFHAPEKTANQLLSDAEHEVSVGDRSAMVLPAAVDPLAGLPAFMAVPDHVSASMASAAHGYRIVLGKFDGWAVEDRFIGDPLVATSRALDPLWLDTVAEGRRHGPSTLPASIEAPVASADLQAQADQLIARSNAGDLFENVTTGKLIGIRHKPSSFTCTFEPSQSENDLQVFGGSVRGSDIGCTTRLGLLVSSFFVTRFPGAVPSPQQAMQVYLAGIRQMHPDMAEAKGPFVTANLPAKPDASPPVQRLTAHMTYVDHGEAAYSRISVAVVKGWVVEQRITAPLAQQQQADLIGEIMMIAAVDKMNREQAS